MVANEPNDLDTIRHYFLVFVLIGLSFFMSGESWAHDVGEPALENSQIWNQCCGDGDCVSQQLRIIGKRNGSLEVEIDGVPTSVDKEKFSPVPSDHTWVCYFQPNGKI